MISTPKARPAASIAVVCSSYAKVNLVPERNPIFLASGDAESVANMLKKSGYQVTLVKDVGYLDFKRAIRAFEDSAGDADVAVIFYAGHGIEIAGTNCLIPVDTKLASDRDASDEAIDLNRLISTVDGVKRLRLIILDACRDNPFLSRMKRRQVQRQITSGLGPVNVGSDPRWRAHCLAWRRPNSPCRRDRD
jgi:uncharacterized caspase-like protein